MGRINATKLKRLTFNGGCFHDANDDLGILNCLLNKSLFVENLTLSHLEVSNWGAVSLKGKALKSLAITQTNVTDVFLENIPVLSELKEVFIEGQDNITGAGLTALVSSCRNITSFEY